MRSARYVIQTWRFEHSLRFLVHGKILDRKFSGFLHKAQIYPVSDLSTSCIKAQAVDLKFDLNIEPIEKISVA